MRVSVPLAIKDKWPTAGPADWQALLMGLKAASQTLKCPPEGTLALLEGVLPLQAKVPFGPCTRVRFMDKEGDLTQWLRQSLVPLAKLWQEIFQFLLRLPASDTYQALQMLEVASLALATHQDFKTLWPDVQPVRTFRTETPPVRTFRTKPNPLLETTLNPKPAKAPPADREKLAQSLKQADQVLARSQQTLKCHRETFADKGQVVATNPLLQDFL